MNQRRRLIVLGTCCLSLLLVTMDMTIVNVALPSIRSDLHASVEGLQWAIDGYTVVVASLLMLSGSLADRFGRRRTFQIGLAVFSLGSLACSLAPTAAVLVAARVLQAIGGSMLNPVAMSIVANTFPDAKERARAIGIWGAVFGISMAAGPLLGGALIDSLGWRSIFWINVPIAAVALVLTARFIPESRAERPRSLDLGAQALIIVGLFALTAAVIELRTGGFASGPARLGFAVVVLAGLALAAWEMRQIEPLVDIRLFRSSGLGGAMSLAVLSFASFSAFLFLNALYLQEARKLSAAEAGMATLPIALALVVSSPLSGRLVAAGRRRLAIGLSGAAMASGALLLTRLANDTPMPLLMAAYATFGIGIGSIGAPVNTAAIAAVPPSHAGLASAMASTSRQVGVGLGVALAGALAGTGIEAGHSAELARSTHQAFWVMAALGSAVVLLGLLSTAVPARAPATRAPAGS